MFSLKGKVPNRKAMLMLMNVLNYLRRTNENISETILNEVIYYWLTSKERTAEACGVSVTKAWFKEAESQGSLISSPRKTANRPETKSIDVNDFVKAAVHRKIYYCHNKLLPVTLSSLTKVIRDHGVFEFSLMSLKRLLPTIGFTYHVDDQQRGLLGQPHIASLRAIFLRQYTKNEEERLFDPIYLDETWMFGRGSLGKSLLEK